MFSIHKSKGGATGWTGMDISTPFSSGPYLFLNRNDIKRLGMPSGNHFYLLSTPISQSWRHPCIREHFLSLENGLKILIRCQSLFFENLLLVLPFLCHKSATTCQVDSSMVSNSKLKPDPCSCVKIEIIESTTPPQYPHKRANGAQISWNTMQIMNSS